MESLVLTKVAFQVLLPAIGFIMGAILGIVFVIWAFITAWWLGLIALALAGAAVWLLSIWDKRRIARIEAEIKDLNLPPPDRRRP